MNRVDEWNVSGIAGVEAITVMSYVVGYAPVRSGRQAEGKNSPIRILP